MAQDDTQIKQPAAGTSLVGSGLSILGDVTGAEDLVVDGRISGKIDLGAHDLTIRPGGRVEGEVRARNVSVHGEIEGNVFAAERVFIAATGRMKGDIVAATVSILAGSQFKGAIRMERTQRDVPSL